METARESSWRWSYAAMGVGAHISATSAMISVRRMFPSFVAVSMRGEVCGMFDDVVGPQLLKALFGGCASR